MRIPKANIHYKIIPIHLLEPAEMVYINTHKTECTLQIKGAIAGQIWKFSEEAWNDIVDHLRVEIAQAK